MLIAGSWDERADGTKAVDSYCNLGSLQSQR